MPPRTTAPEPIEAPRPMCVGSNSQSSSVCRAPPSPVARGRLSLMNITPCPTKTSSPMCTPSQMNEWLWILQRAPTVAPRWISTKGPMRLASPIEQPYRLVNEATRTSSPKVTSSISRCGASFAGASAIEERPDAVGDRGDLAFGDAGEHRQRQALARECLCDRERAAAVTEVCVRVRQMHRIGVVPAGCDLTHTQEISERVRVGCPDDIEVPDRSA